MARLAGVSVATVSYVLNDSPKPISVETRQRVLEAIRQLDYKPHAIARSLKTGSTSSIGLVISALASPGMAFMANKVQDELLKHGYQAIIANTHESSENEANMLDLLTSQPVDGLIVSPASIHERSRFEKIINLGIPLVFMDRYVAGLHADIVATNNIQAAKAATEYLLQQECRQILCLSYSATASSALERVEGYRKGLEAQGLRPDEDRILVVQDPDNDPIEKAYVNHIHTFGEPDGVLCTTQELGIGFMRMLRRRGGTIPGQKIVVFDADWAELLTPPVPVVRQDLVSIAITAVRLMIERLAGSSSSPRSIYYDATLVVP